MEAEKFLKPDEFARLLKAAKGILLLSAGAGLWVGETVAIRAEEAYQHIRSSNAKLKKARTVLLLPVIDVLQKYLADRSEGWLFPGYSGEHVSARQVQKILDRIVERSGLQKVEHQDMVGPGRYRIHPSSFAAFVCYVESG